MSKSVRVALLRVGSIKRLTKGILPGLVPEDNARPYVGG